jgi:hypothetical protein
MEIEKVAPSIHHIEQSQRRSRRVHGLLGGLLAGLLLCAAPIEAQAQSCMYNITSAFGRLRGVEARAISQAVADAEVQGLFGPRPGQCEEGAYRVFMDNLESFSKAAMRATPAASRDKLLRLAIAATRQAPSKVPARDLDAALAQYRQVKSNLSATAEDVGLDKTPLLQQLMDAVAAIGKPEGVAATVSVPPPEATPQPTTTSGVQQVRVPPQPLPPWAVIKIYEARDLVKAQDLPGIQLRLQEVINWMEASTRDGR